MTPEGRLMEILAHHGLADATPTEDELAFRQKVLAAFHEGIKARCEEGTEDYQELPDCIAEIGRLKSKLSAVALEAIASEARARLFEAREEKLVGVLEFYGKEENWKCRGSLTLDDPIILGSDAVSEDKGQIARTTLKELKDD